MKLTFPYALKLSRTLMLTEGKVFLLFSLLLLVLVLFIWKEQMRSIMGNGCDTWTTSQPPLPCPASLRRESYVTLLLASTH